MDNSPRSSGSKTPVRSNSSVGGQRSRRHHHRERTPGPAAQAAAARLPSSLRVNLDDEEATSPQGATAHEKWARVRTIALSFFTIRKARYDMLVMERYERIKEMCIYFSFVVLFTYVAISTRNTDAAHDLVSGMQNTMEQAELPYTDVPNYFFYFADLVTLDDVWQYYVDVTLNNLFSAYPQQNIRVPVLGNNLIIGPVRLRQVRVQQESCGTPPIFNGMGLGCYPPYNEGTPQTATDPDGTWLPCFNSLFGPNVSMPIQPWMQYQTNSLPAFANSVLETNYGNDGYVIEIGPNNISAGLTMVNQARACGWINENSTRAFFLEYAVYNPNVNMVATAVMATENLASGTVQTSSTWRAVQLDRSLRTASIVSIILEYIVYAWVLLYIVIEYRNLRVLGFRAYVSDGYNVIAVLNLVVFLVVCALDTYSITQSKAIMDRADGSEPQNYELQGLSFYTYQVYNWNSFNGLLTWVRLVKYLDIISKKTTQLAATLGRATKSVAALALVFIIIYFGYALAFFLAFGQDVDTWHTVSSALFGLFLTILGDFDFDNLYASNRILGPILFFSYVCVVSFILLNMFLAVIMRSYEEVTTELATAKDELASFMRRQIRRWVHTKVAAFLEQGELQTDDSFLAPSELALIYQEDQVALQAIGLNSWQDMVRVADLSAEWGLDLEDLTGLHEEMSKTAAEQTKENQLAYLLLNIVERTNAIVQEQQLIRAHVERTYKNAI